MSNTIKYQEEWAVALQERLARPTNWKEHCDVLYTDSQVFELPYVATASESAFQTGLTRGNTYTFQDITQSTETLTIGTYDILAELLDRADEAQSNYAKRMDRARLQGDKANERVQVIAQTAYATATNIGDTGAGVIGLGSNAITLTGNNVDDLIRAVIEQIHTATGTNLYMQNGGFIEWRPAEWTSLMTFMQSNGFQFADEALRGGNKNLVGKELMGLFHYLTTSNASHIAGGVRKVLKLGLLKSTYGQIYITEDPAGASGGNISGISVNTRVDHGTKIPTVASTLVYDINA